MKLTSWLRPGSLVAWWDGGRLGFAVVAGEEKQRIRLWLEGGREQRVTPSRIALEIDPGCGDPLADSDGRSQATARLEELLGRVRELADEIDLELLWELVLDQDPASAAPVADLAGLALRAGDAPSTAAMLLALVDDGLYFVRRGDDWEPRQADAVAEIRGQRERERQRLAEKQAVHDLLADAAAGREFRLAGHDTERRYLEALEQIAIYEDRAPDASKALALEALEASKLRFDRPHEGAFRLLRRLGIFTADDENLTLRRFRIRVGFPEPVSACAARLAARGFARDDRRDLTRLDPFSVDSAETFEIDDALSIERIAGAGFRIGVHIADPGAFVLPGDPVDEEALARSVTHYHPGLRATMLPPEIAEQAASLVAGEDRPVLSFLIELSAQGEIERYEIVPAVIRVGERMDYGLADERAAQAGLTELADIRRGARARSGAILLEGPEVEVHVDGEGTPHLKRIDTGSPSRRAVSEAMILAGEVAARFCAERELPVVYRRQSAATDLPDLADALVRDPVELRRMRRRMKRGEASMQPGLHFGLGLPAYTQVTSPLRRFQDLANQRQIVSSLRGEAPVYDHEAMQRVAATTDRADRDSRLAERIMRDYWVLRYLEHRVGETVEAVVVEDQPRPVLQLVETLWTQPMPSLKGSPAGASVQVKIERVNPRAGLLVLRRID